MSIPNSGQSSNTVDGDPGHAKLAMEGGLYLAPHIPGGLRRSPGDFPESTWSPGAFFFGWEHGQIGMNNPPGFHQESRWTPHEPSGVSGVHLPDSRVESTWTQARNNPPGVWEES